MTIIVGHRGACGYAPENTLKSFRTAIDIGCDRAELDVRMTKDNQIVVIHDEEVSKPTNGRVFVKDLTLAELKELSLDRGEKIPTLQEVIDVCKNKINLQIELKADGTPAAVNQHILRNKLENQVVITSFNDHWLKEIKNLNPNLKVGLLIHKDEALNNAWTQVISIPLDFFALFHELITKELIDKAHALGKIVHGYAVNDKAAGDKLMSMGIDSIGTDYPKLFIPHKDFFCNIKS